MIEEKEKQQIDAKLRVAGIDNITPQNKGKLKRIVQLLYNNEPDKKLYMMLEIAKRDPNFAMEIAKELKDNQKIIECITDMMTQNVSGENEDILTIAINHFHQGNICEFAKKTMEIFPELEKEDKDRIWKLFRSFGQILQFVETCLENDLIYDILFCLIIVNSEFNYGDVLEARSETGKIADLLYEKECYNTCVVLIKKISVHKYYRLYRISYQKFIHIIENQTFMKNTEKLKLGYCRVSYSPKYNSYEIYRKGNKGQLEEKAYWIYLSLLYEYLSTGTYTELHLDYFKKLEPCEIDEKYLTHGELFSSIAYVIQGCVKEKGDVKALLNMIKNINICRMDYEPQVYYERYDKGVLLQESGVELLRKYAEDAPSIDDIFELYFNTYLKYAVSLNTFFRLWKDRDDFSSKMVQWLGSIPFKGRITVKDDSTLMIKPFHFKVEKNLVFELLPADRNKFEKWSEILFRLKWEEWHVQISQVKAETDVQENLAESVEEVLGHIEQLCDEPGEVLKYIENISWNKVYHSKCYDSFCDFAFFRRYAQRIKEILNRVIKNTENTDDAVKLYMDSFFKVSLPLNDFYNLLELRYGADSVVKGFQEYAFVMKQFGRETISFRPIQVCAYQYQFVNDKPAKVFKGKCMARFHGVDSERKLQFTYDDEATYDIFICEGINAMIRAFETCSTNSKGTKELYDRIRKVPLEYYDDKPEIMNKIAGIVRQSMDKRAHIPQELCNYIKGLSLHNMYCSRLNVDKEWLELSEYRYDSTLVAKAENMTKILARNSQNISVCLFVFINSYLKQYLSAEEFLELCFSVNPKMEDQNVKYSMSVLGNFKKNEKGEYLYSPTSIFCEKYFKIQEWKDLEDKMLLQKINATMILEYTDGKIDWKLDGIKRGFEKS